MKKFIVTCAVGEGMALGARADILLTLDTGLSGPAGPNFEWVYAVEASSLDFDFGALAILADFPGYVSGSLGSTTYYFDDSGLGEFTLSENLDTGYLPDILSGTPDDNVALWDVEMAWDGGPVSPGSGTLMGYLHVQTSYDFADAVLGGSFWATTDGGGSYSSGWGPALVPAGEGGGEVPEASTLVSTAFIGLAGAAYIVRRRRMQAAKA